MQRKRMSTDTQVADYDQPCSCSVSAYLAGIVPAPISNLKVRQLKDGVIAIAILALAAFDGSVYNPQKVS